MKLYGSAYFLRMSTEQVINMSNTSEANDDSETDAEQRSSTKSSLRINWSSETNSSKSRSPLFYSPASDYSSDGDGTKEGLNNDCDAVNRLYLRKLEEYRNGGGSVDEEIQDCYRKVQSAPLMATRLSGRVCTLKAIDENEEYDFSNDSLDRKTELSPAESDPEEEGLIVTPRQKEVPPKRKCVRTRTPVVSKGEEIDEADGSFPSQKINIGEKTFIVRSTGAQVRDGSDKLRREELNEEEFARKRAKRTNEVTQVTNLPHSVEDTAIRNVTLEPNIVILDDKSSSGGGPRNSPMGDASSPGENRSSKIKNKVSIGRKASKLKSNTVRSMEKCWGSNSSEEKFSAFSCHVPRRTPPLRVQNSTAVILQRSIDERVSASVESRETKSPRLDKTVCRAILGDFRLETAVADAYPITFEELIERDQKADTFKHKGVELIEMLGGRDTVDGERYGSSPSNPGEIRRMVPKTRLLMDDRRGQSADMEFYDIADATSPESSSFATDPEQTRIDGDNGATFCCFRLFEFLRLRR